MPCVFVPSSIYKYIYPLKLGFIALFRKDNWNFSSASIVKEGFTEKISNDWEYSVGFSKDPFINITHPRAAYLEVNNAYLTGDRAYLFLDKNRYIDDFSEGPHIDKSKIRHPISWLSETLDGTVFHLSGPNHENHGHFITQFLPRLLLMKDLLDKNPSIKILIAPGHKTWQSNISKFWGLIQIVVFLVQRAP